MLIVPRFALNIADQIVPTMRKFDTINVIPFIDIMLVLLAIVLTTATFIRNGQLDIALPAASTSSGGDAPERLEIAIDKQQEIFFEGLPVSMVMLEQALDTHAPDTPILLRIDEAVPFSQFVSIIDLLKVNQLDNVSILTQTLNNANANAASSGAGN